MLALGADPVWEPWAAGFLFSPALTVGGGTSEVLRNVIAERILGLPHDVDVDQGLTWAESRARLREQRGQAGPTGGPTAGPTADQEAKSPA
jgi:hypothetical protein